MPYGDEKSYAFFKMKGSPHKLGTIKGASAYKKKAGPPTKGFDVDKIIDEDAAKAQRIALAELTAELEAGQITEKQFETRKKEISKYIEY